MAKSHTSSVESLKTQSTARKLSFDDNIDFEKSTDVSEDFQLDCDFIIKTKTDSHAKSAPMSCFKKLCFDSAEDNNDFCLPGLQNKTASCPIFSFEAEACEKEIFSQSSGDSTMEEEVSSSQEITIDIFMKGSQYQLENRRRCDSFQTDSEERLESLDGSTDIVSQGMASQAPCLPISANLRDPDLWTISSQTLVNLISEGKRRYLIIDCRYDYEYKGGHIQDAINIDSRECLERLFFNNKLNLNQNKHLEQVKQDLQEFFRGSYLIGPSEDEESSEPPILIFHCEFSQKRGPRAMRALRSLDRQLNVHRWPELYYPQTYLLEEGYQSFQGLFPDYCNPHSGYVKMLDKKFKQEYSSARENEKKSWKKTISFKHVGETTRFSQRSKTISY